MFSPVNLTFPYNKVGFSRVFINGPVNVMYRQNGDHKKNDYLFVQNQLVKVLPQRGYLQRNQI